MSRVRSTAALLAIACAAACSSAEEEDCSFHPGQQWFAFSSAEGGSWDIHLAKENGHCRRALTADAALDVSPAWGPGGVLAFESDRAPFTSVWITSAGGGALRRLDVGDLRAASPSFSPDGRQLAFAGILPGAATSGVYLAPVEGGVPTLLTADDAAHANGRPVFAPDGSRIYFVSNREQPASYLYDVWAVPTTGGAAVRITTDSGIQGRPAVSFDGATLAYARAATGGTEVVLLELASGTTRVLGVRPAAEPAFGWGNTVAVRVTTGTSSALQLVRTDTAAATPLTSGPGPDSGPACSPGR